MTQRICADPDCTDPALPGRTVCNFHKKNGIGAVRAHRKGEWRRWMGDAIANRSRLECWLDWPFGHGTDGRPATTNGYAARDICEMVHGPAPAGTIACHSTGCRSPHCLNPDHLRWDTWQANTLDIAARHVLMGRLAERGMTADSLARWFHLPVEHVERILREG